MFMAGRPAKCFRGKRVRMRTGLNELHSIGKCTLLWL